MYMYDWQRKNVGKSISVIVKNGTKGVNIGEEYYT